MESILISRTQSEGERNYRSFQPRVTAVYTRTAGNHVCDSGPRMKIDTWFGFSQIIKGCVFGHCVDISHHGLPIYFFYDLHSPLEKSLPALLPLELQQPDLHGPGSATLQDFLVLLPGLISMHPQRPDAAGLSDHYLWIILLIDLQLFHAVSASMCVRVGGSFALGIPKSSEGKG